VIDIKTKDYGEHKHFTDGKCHIYMVLGQRKKELI